MQCNRKDNLSAGPPDRTINSTLIFINFDYTQSSVRGMVEEVDVDCRGE